MRRAIYHSWLLGCAAAANSQAACMVVDMMGDV